MAKIFIKGKTTPIEIEEERAKALKQDWLKGRLPNIIDLETVTIKASEIKMIELTSDIKEKFPKKGLDLDNPEDLKEVKNFEKDFKKFMRDNPKLANWEGRIFIHLIWFERLGAIKINGDTSRLPSADNCWNVNYDVIDMELFNKLQQRFSAWNLLRWKRERAKQFEKEAREILE